MYNAQFIRLLFSVVFLVSILNAPVMHAQVSKESAAADKSSLTEKQEKIFLSLAESLYKDGEYVRALSIYLDFMELYPDSSYGVRAMETMAELYEKQQMYSEALSMYEDLYQKTGLSSSKGMRYYYNQARLLNTMGYVQEASAIYANIVKMNPDSPYAKKSQINKKLNTLFTEPEQLHQPENNSSQNE